MGNSLNGYHKKTYENGGKFILYLIIFTIIIVIYINFCQFSVLKDQYF